MSDQRLTVAVLGATGTVGQRFVSLLDTHPWFRVSVVTGSERSIGRRYGDAAPWSLPGSVPATAAGLEVLPTSPEIEADLVFSALGSDIADEAESAFRDAGHFVVTNAGSHRMDADVPLIVPEVNAGHLEMLRDRQQPGAIVANPNCSTIGLVLALAPLVERFGVETVNVVTLQAISGAGLPGVPSMTMLDNLVPYIPNEEEKLEEEAGKILGRLDGGTIEARPITVSAQCNRVGVLDGHTECLSLGLAEPASPGEIAETLRTWDPEATRELPSAPHPPIVVLDDVDRPQPRLDRDRGRGMAVSVGRIRECPIADIRMVVLSHNTLRGAAGGALLAAELAVARRLVGR